MSDLPQQQTIVQYVADGVTAAYIYDFLIPTDVDINIYVTPSGDQANDAADIQMLGVNYSVQNAGNLTGGTFTFLPGFIPALGDIVTGIRNVEASIDTNYQEARTIIGANLDDSFEREMLVIQQNQTKINERVLRYQFSSYVPDTTNKNIVPTLSPGYIWIGSAAGGVAAAFLDQNPDASTLRSELASETQGSDGAGLVGYYDEAKNIGTTVRDQLNHYGSSTIGNDGASYIGYYDVELGVSMTVAEALNTPIVTGEFPGDFVFSSSPAVRPGRALCNGASYDMVGALSSTEIRRLGNTYKDNGMLPIYGVGVDSFITVHSALNTVTHTCSVVGSAAAPDPHTSGFSIVITQPGTVSVPQIVTVTTTAGNTISAGAYYEIKAPSGRSTLFWFEVNGSGTAPVLVGALIAKVAILSTDTADQVAEKIFLNSFMQYRVPNIPGYFPRLWGGGATIDPNSASRTNFAGTVVGNVVGSFQTDAYQDHIHYATNQNPALGFANVAKSFATPGNFDNDVSSSLNGAIYSPTTGLTEPGLGYRTSTETRPSNILIYTSVLF